MRALLIAAIVSLLSVGASATPAPHSQAFEGVVIDIAEGSEVRWEVGQGPFIVHFAADEQGLIIDASATDLSEDRIILRGHSSSGYRFDATRPEQVLHVLNGSGRSVLLRTELSSGLPMQGPPARVATSGILEPPECRGYYFTTAHMRDPARIAAEGAGGRFAVFTSAQLLLRAKAEDRLQLDVDPQRDSDFVIQACAGDHATSFAVSGTYPAAPLPTGQPGTPASQVPSTIALAICALAGSAILLDRRR